MHYKLLLSVKQMLIKDQGEQGELDQEFVLDYIQIIILELIF
jgi:hypothetical protein